MNIKISITFFFLVLLFSSCSLWQNKQDASQQVGELSIQDSLEITALFIEAKTDALLDNGTLAMEKYEAIIKQNPLHDAAWFEMSRMYSSHGDYREAEKYAEKAAEINPENVWYRKMLVDLYQRTGKLDESRQHLKYLVEHEKNNLTYYQDWYNLERYLENYEEALKITRQMEKITGTNEKVLKRKINLYQKLDQYEEAIRVNQQLLELDSTNKDYYMELIAMYNHIGEPDKALQVIQRFKEQQPEDGMVELMLAQQYHENGEHQESLQALKRAFANKTLSIDAKVNVLLSYFSLKDTQDSLRQQQSELIDLLIKTHPDNAISHSMQGDFFMKHQEYDKALKSFENVIALDSSRYPVWEQTLRLQLQLNKNKKCIKYAGKAIRFFPDKSLLYLLKGAAHIRRDQYQQAVESLEKGLYFVADTRQKIEFYSYLGDSYQALEKYESSVHYYEQALALDSDNVYVLNNYAYYLSLRQEDLPKALKMIEKVRDRHPDNVTYLDTYGWVLFQMEEYDRALAVFETIMNKDNDPGAEILEHYGDCLFMTGQKEKAIKSWERALEKEPANDVLQHKIEQKTLKPDYEKKRE
ncbi:MAG: tetratricopeptide repeat protein [Bacteroidota bacterium]